MSERKIELSVVMPCLNEARTIKQCVKDAQAFMRRKNIEGEIIVVDNGSTDDSAKLAKACGARVVEEKRRGYGRALRTGFEVARGEYIIMGDCDRTYDFAHMTRMWKRMQSCDLIVGDRFKANLEKGAMSLSHNIGVKVLSWLGRLRFKTDVYDFHCGIRGMRREAIKKLKFRTTGMEFATEMIAEAARNGLRIKQVPVDYRNSVKGRRPKLNTIRDGFRHLDYILVGTMKPFWREFWRLVSILIVSAGVGLGLLWGVAQIPRSMIREQVQESTDYYLSGETMKPDLIGGLYSTKADYYADGIWLSMAYGYDGSLRSVIESKYAYLDDESQGYNMRLQLDGELEINKPYFRYWHGAIAWVRPLLVFLNARQIYALCGVVLMLLFAVIIGMLCRHKEYMAAGIFVLSMLIGGGFLAWISLEYIQVFFVMCITSILMMRAVWKGKRKCLPYLFFVSGIVVNYLDFLTAETLTLTVPLLLVLWLDRKKAMKERGFEKVLKMMFYWVAGYALMWAAKWLIAWIALGDGVWGDVGTQMGVRSFKLEEGLSFTQMVSTAVESNVGGLFPLCFGSIFGLLAAIVVSAMLLVACLKSKQELNWFWIVAMILIGAIPILRGAVTIAHLVRHFFFTYRALAGTAMAFLMLCFNTIDWKRKGKKTFKNII